MRFDVVTLFPAMFDAIAGHGVTGRALQQGLWSLQCWNPRDYATRANGRLDDRPFGGGPGMVMEAEPLRACVEAIDTRTGTRQHRILLSPGGKPLRHSDIARLGQLSALTLVAGRYEGIDQRFTDSQIDEVLCVGDIVVSGGELPAMMLIDALVRWIPGVLHDEDSAPQDSFAAELLDHAHYTRPEVWKGLRVPEVLLGGDHRAIGRWRRASALLTTARVRPELLASARHKGVIGAEDEALLAAQQGIPAVAPAAIPADSGVDSPAAIPADPGVEFPAVIPADSGVDSPATAPALAGTARFRP